MGRPDNEDRPDDGGRRAVYRGKGRLPAVCKKEK